jgi:ribosomal protein S6E (S10)
MAIAMNYKGLWVSAWFVALLIFNVANHWTQNADKNTLYIFLSALGQLTSPLQLLLSVAIVYGIFLVGEPRSVGEAQPTKRPLTSRPAFRTVCVMAGLLALIIVITLVATFPRRGTKPVATGALDNYEIMSKSTATLGTEQDGISPEAKKRMREGLALQLSGGLQKQGNPMSVEVVGDNHDILVFQMPSMNAEQADELIQEFRKNGANFWNGMRLMNYRQVVFTGDGYKRVVERQEFLGYGQDYDKYKADFLKATGDIHAGAQGELGKP